MSSTADTRVARVPGEAGLWVFILGDMTVFALLFGAFLYERAQQPAVFAASQPHLTTAFGAVNTAVLLTSSLLVALAVHVQRNGGRTAARRMLTGALGCAAVFVGLKAAEWGALLQDGFDPATDHFFTYYFAITGVHLLHLLLGTAGLVVMRHRVGANAAGPRDRLIVEAGASYWHMVDLLWVVIFPLVYFAAT